jgi:Ca2+-binding RTX toxin-like protein
MRLGAGCNVANGDDVICAGYGEDMVDRGNSQELILGEQGDDTIARGNGKDTQRRRRHRRR